MKKINFSNSRISRILSGKGFYVALCLCLVAIGGAGFVAYNQTVDKISKVPSISVPDTTSQTEWDFDAVDKPQTSVPKDEVAVAAQPMVMPLNGEVQNPFSNGELVKSQTTQIWKTHDGVDIKGDIGTQIKSMTNGTVKKIAQDAIYGAYVVIDHGNGLEGYYCNLNTVLPVKEGDKVSAGTIVGAIGDTAESEMSEPSHLHFALKLNGAWVDPISTITPGK